ncbi:hypothetical protein FB45DRAFT_900994, partial [Roridomyces roridus]
MLRPRRTVPVLTFHPGARARETVNEENFSYSNNRREASLDLPVVIVMGNSSDCSEGDDRRDICTAANSINDNHLRSDVDDRRQLIRCKVATALHTSLDRWIPSAISHELETSIFHLLRTPLSPELSGRPVLEDGNGGPLYTTSISILGFIT